MQTARVSDSQSKVPVKVVPELKTSHVFNTSHPTCEGRVIEIHRCPSSGAINHSGPIGGSVLVCDTLYDSGTQHLLFFSVKLSISLNIFGNPVKGPRGYHSKSRRSNATVLLFKYACLEWDHNLYIIQCLP